MRRPPREQPAEAGAAHRVTRSYREAEEIQPPAPIGVVGCGTMGRLLVQSVGSAGYRVVAYDTDREALSAAAELGAEVAPGVRAVGERCAAVLLSLPGPREVRAVAGELLEGRPGLVIVDTSTSDPETTRSLARRAEAVGKYFLDAPILGRPATWGQWTVPVGGTSEGVARARRVLEAFAARVVPVGEAGTGHTVKLLNQMMFAVLNAVTAEVLSTASRVGVHPEVFYECLVTSGAATVSSLFREVGAKIARHDFTPVFSVDLLCKDTDLAVGMARAAGAAPLLTGIAQVLGHTAKARGLGDLDSAAVVRVYEDLLANGGEDQGSAHGQRGAGS